MAYCEVPKLHLSCALPTELGAQSCSCRNACVACALSGVRADQYLRRETSIRARAPRSLRRMISIRSQSDLNQNGASPCPHPCDHPSSLSCHHGPRHPTPHHASCSYAPPNNSPPSCVCAPPNDSPPAACSASPSDRPPPNRSRISYGPSSEATRYRSGDGAGRGRAGRASATAAATDRACHSHACHRSGAATGRACHSHACHRGGDHRSADRRSADRHIRVVGAAARCAVLWVVANAARPPRAARAHQSACHHSPEIGGNMACEESAKCGRCGVVGIKWVRDLLRGLLRGLLRDLLRGLL